VIQATVSVRRRCARASDASALGFSTRRVYSAGLAGGQPAGMRQAGRSLRRITGPEVASNE
jgi:hypothetical protein